MASFNGRFVWYELRTTDTQAARAFYGRVVGWNAKASPVPGIEYGLFSAGEAPVAGLIALPESAKAAGAPPGWIGYVSVRDVDAMAAKAVQLGGRVHAAPSDIPGIGRSAIIADPQGAAFALFSAAMAPAEGCGPPPLGTLGHVGWHELFAADREAAFAFYAEMFGWTKADAVDLGAMGVYQLFACGGQTVGGMMTMPPGVPAPHWGYYFSVSDIEAAADRVGSAGGTVRHGPMQVPGGSWILAGNDPQGAGFALVAAPTAGTPTAA